MRNPDGTAEGTFIVVLSNVWFCQTGVVVVPGICGPICLPRCPQEISVETTATGLEKCIEISAASPSHFRIIGIALNLHFLHCFDGRHDRWLVGDIRDGYPINLVVI